MRRRSRSGEATAKPRHVMTESSRRDLYRSFLDSGKSAISIRPANDRAIGFGLLFAIVLAFSAPRLCPTTRPSVPPPCRRESDCNNERPTSYTRGTRRELPRAFAPRAGFPTASDISAFCGITSEDALPAVCTYCRMRLHSYAAIVSASPNCPQVECNELHHGRAYVIPLRR